MKYMYFNIVDVADVSIYAAATLNKKEKLKLK